MAKSTPHTPHFNDMMAARGGMGVTAQAPAGKKMPPKPAPKAMPKGGKMQAPPMAPDGDWDGK